MNLAVSPAENLAVSPAEAGLYVRKVGVGIGRDLVESGFSRTWRRVVFSKPRLSDVDEQEMESPFLDRDLLEFTLKVPTRHLIQDARQKALLRD